MNILILEDEIVAARRLQRLTRRILSEEVERLDVAHGLSDALRLLAGENFDLILLDLNLSGEDGFDLLAEGVGAAQIIVVSAHPDRAIEAFHHAVLDFVPKPVIEARLRQALNRARCAPLPQTSGRLVVRSQGRADIVDLASVVRISGADDYSEILLTNGRVLLCSSRLSDFARELPCNFVRAHRSFLVNLQHVQAFEQKGPALRHANGEITPISRRRLHRIRALLRRPDLGVSG